MIRGIPSGNPYVQYLNNSNRLLNQSTERLSTGQKINRASDDAAGLAISQKLLAQMKGMTIASKNIQDGILVIQTAEASTKSIAEIVQDMRELAVKASSDSYTATEREAMNVQFQAYATSITEIANAAEFNGKKLLDGSLATNGLRIMSGANAGQHIEVKMGDFTYASLLGDNSANADLDLTTQVNAQAMVGIMDTVMNNVSAQRSTIGAAENRLNHAYNISANTHTNLAKAYDNIMGVDTAEEMMKITNEQIKQQATQYAMNLHMQNAQNVLSLLR